MTICSYILIITSYKVKAFLKAKRLNKMEEAKFREAGMVSIRFTVRDAEASSGMAKEEMSSPKNQT